MKVAVGLSLAAVAAASRSFKAETIHSGAAPILSSTNAEHVPDSYIIKFKSHVSPAAASEHHSWVQDLHTGLEAQRIELRRRDNGFNTFFSGLKHTFSLGSDFMGYSGHFDEETIEKVRNHPDVSNSSKKVPDRILSEVCSLTLSPLRSSTSSGTR